MMGFGIVVSLLFLARSLTCESGIKLPDACPKVMLRSDWGARPPKSTSPMVNPVPYVVIHHSVMSPCSDSESCKRSMREMQDFHMDENGWDDIGYSFLVGGDGVVYQGRGWSRVGAHAPNYNDKSIGICIVGDFTELLPTQAQLDAAKAMIQCGIDNDLITDSYVLLGHRDVRATECPGETLYQEILTWPHKGLPPAKLS